MGLGEGDGENMPTQPKEHDMDFSVIFLDIDNFKLMNTTNRLFTDDLLIEFAHFLRASTRAEDVVARWGGDEFILIALGTTREEAENLCGKIQRRMKEYAFKFGAEPVHVTFSFGVVSTAEKEWSDLETIVNVCMSRMEAQKKSKKSV
jgi:diguanylate cyclase (GGDEF)-like protein